MSATAIEISWIVLDDSGREVFATSDDGSDIRVHDIKGTEVAEYRSKGYTRHTLTTSEDGTHDVHHMHLTFPEFQS